MGTEVLRELPCELLDLAGWCTVSLQLQVIIPPLPSASL